MSQLFRYGLILFFFSFLTHAISQSGDSLIAALSLNADNPEKKADLLNQLARLYSQSLPKESLRYCDKLLYHAEKNNRSDWMLNSHMIAGIAHISAGDLDQASYHWMLAGELAEKDTTPEGPKNRIKVRINLQGLKLNLKEYDEALMLGRKNLMEIRKEGYSLMLADAFQALASTFLASGQVDSTMYYAQLAAPIYERLQQSEKWCNSMITLAKSWHLNSQYNRADSIMRLVLPLAKEKQHSFVVVNSIGFLTKNLLQQGKTDSAEVLLRSMDGIPAFTENINMRIQYHELLSEVYRHQSMTDSAVFHLKKAFELKDQRLNEQKLRAIHELEQVYKAKQSAVENQELLEEQAITEANNRALGFLLLLTITLLILGIITYFKLQRKHRQLSAVHRRAAEINQRLIALIDERQHFVHLITHHLRTPLMIIQLQARSLLSMPADSTENDRKKILEKIDRATEDIHLASTTLLNTQLEEDTSFYILPVNFALKLLIREVIIDLDALAISKQIAITFKPGKETLYVLADSMLTRQILFNVLSNAIEYCPEKSRVCISLEKSDDFVSIHTEDNGPGIPEASVQKLFMASPVSNPESDGRGNGLLLSKRFAQKMGGDLQVESSAGKGTRVLLILPIGSAQRLNT
jgi:signal transduction histidine kinase